MSEAVEYRIQAAKYTVELVGSMLIVGVSGVMVFVGFDSFLHALIALEFLALGCAVASGARAMYVDGYNRRLWEYLKRDGFDDPPLKTWLAELEERDAFAVDGGEKA